MNVNEIREIVKRIDGIWPPRKAPMMEERQEWVRFLTPLEFQIAMDGIDLMREELKFRPAMSDFLAFYHHAAVLPDEIPLQLPPAPDAGGEVYVDTVDDIYGKLDDRVYCWKCDQAITLEERSGCVDGVEHNYMLHDVQRGLFHRRCPRSGSAPSMPVHLRIERQEWFVKHKISSTP